MRNPIILAWKSQLRSSQNRLSLVRPIYKKILLVHLYKLNLCPFVLMDLVTLLNYEFEVCLFIFY